ncbi:MAG: hypothetical protein M3112_05965 [Actinomycetia bacterium]|nr:hypothetical protein [Actinomycetes bacterium]
MERIADQLSHGHELAGSDCVIVSDVPVGIGLSSSAALELAVARSFTEVFGIAWDPVTMALAG